MPILHTIYLLLLAVTLAGVTLASLVAFLGRLWWIFDLFSHFRLQYAVLSLICALGFLLGGEPVGFFISFGFGLLNLALLYPLYRRKSTRPQSATTYRILSANILGSNADYAQIAQMLDQEKPDIALIVEYDHHHDQGLKQVIAEFPYYFLIPRQDNYGLALLSRLPLASTEAVMLNDDQIPVLVARVEIQGCPVTIIGSHPPPPKRKWMSSMRDRQMLALAHLAAQQSGEVILLGDFNATPWSYSYRDLLQQSKLLDSRIGFGVQATWPAHFPLLKVPIDQILHSAGISITSLSTGCACGSDHHPLIAEFCLQPNIFLREKNKN